MLRNLEISFRSQFVRWSATLLLSLSSVMFGCGEEKPPPTDQALIERFEQHRKEFERLLSITKERAKTQIITRDSAGDPDVASLMQLLMIDSISGFGHEVTFRLPDLGPSLHSVEKGYSFFSPGSNRPLADYIVSSLDGEVPKRGAGGAYDLYRPLGGGWFIHRVVNSDE